MTVLDSINECVPEQFRGLFRHHDGSADFYTMSTADGPLMSELPLGASLHALLTEAAEMAAHLQDVPDHLRLWEMVAEQFLTSIYS